MTYMKKQLPVGIRNNVVASNILFHCEGEEGSPKQPSGLSFCFTVKHKTQDCFALLKSAVLAKTHVFVN